MFAVPAQGLAIRSDMSEKRRIEIEYYTDILCVWAYFGQVKVDELEREFGDRVRIRHRFIPIFGCCEQRVGEDYPDFVLELARDFPHVEVHPRIWRDNVPASSLPVHLVLKAVQLLEERGTEVPEGSAERLARDLRQAFFRELENISAQPVLHRHLEALRIPVAAVEAEIANGNAWAEMALDIEAQRERMIEGSPTFVMNEGRQKLYGNVGYRAIAANVQELLERRLDIPQWC
jgi:predicted DsbA family dithiol-disulfide isomerase